MALNLRSTVATTDPRHDAGTEDAGTEDPGSGATVGLRTHAEPETAWPPDTVAVSVETATGGTARTSLLDRVPRPARRFLGPLLLVSVWTFVTGFGLVDERSLSSPAAVARATRMMWVSGELIEHLVASVQRVAWGLSIGVAIGLALALVAGLFRLGEDVVDSSMNILRTIPTIALLPLIIAWVGIGEPAKIFLIVAGTAFPIYMNTFSAIRGVDMKLVEAGQAFGLGRLGLIRRVILPGALPGFLVGLRWAFGAAWLLLFFSEQINTYAGIGFLINQAQGWNRTDIIIMGLVLYGALGLIGDTIVRSLERSLLAWRRGFGGS